MGIVMIYDLESIKSPEEIFSNPLYCFGDALLLYIYEDTPHIYAETYILLYTKNYVMIEYCCMQ